MVWDGLEGADLHFHAGTGSGFDSGHHAFAADEGDVYAAGGHDAVAFFEAIAVGSFLLGFLGLGTDEEEIKNDNHGDNHDDSLPGVGDVEEYHFEGHKDFKVYGVKSKKNILTYNVCGYILLCGYNIFSKKELMKSEK